MKTIFASLLLLFSHLGFTQLVLPVEQFFETYESFNTDFIKQNKIRSIQLTYSEKMDGEIIITRPAVKRFHFNTNGQPTKEVYIESRGIYTDSSTIHFFFNSENILTQEQIVYQNEVTKRLINYNSKNRIQSIVTTKKIGAVFDTVSIEQYKEPYNDANFAKRIYLNSENRPYLEERLYYQDEQLIREEKDLIITSKSSSKEWIYKEGLLEKIEFSNFINSSEKGYYSFDYYNKNYLEYAYRYLDNQLSEKIAFVYAPNQPTHLDAAVIRYELEGKIEIIQLEYTYY